MQRTPASGEKEGNPHMKKGLERITGQVRKAIQDYNMIQDGDRLALGLSGGKDSLTLLAALVMLKPYFPQAFTLEAVTIDLGFPAPDLSYPLDSPDRISPINSTGSANLYDLDALTEYCATLGIRHTIERTQIGKIVFDYHPSERPCSLCANMRRGALNNVAKSLGCNRVVLAHNRDDLIETLLLSLFYEGRLSAFSPVTYLGRKDLHVIRPMIYTEEKDIVQYIKTAEITPLKNPCTVNGNTKRQEVKELLKLLSKTNRMVYSNIFGAVKRSLLKPGESQPSESDDSDNADDSPEN